jgi:phenylalanyl-tRNA synthetase beta chain
MPVVAISVKRLNNLLGKSYPMDDLVDCLEQLGCDVEDTTELALYRCPACQTPNDKLMTEDAPKRCDYCGHESENPFEQFASDRVIRLDLLADRPDLFDAGGLSRALKGYLNLEKGLPEFAVKPGSVNISVDPKMSDKGTFRPYIVCANVNMPPLDHNSLREIMRLQENLHWGIGRDRKLASIGVYDMDVISPPIRYTTVDPKTFTFCPLGMQNIRMTPEQILREHPKGVGYAHLMEPYKQYPILIDTKDQVLSMPPIINSDETRCKIGTSHVFIDVTGITREAVVNSLNTLVSALIELGGEIETVNMQYPDETIQTPDLTPGDILVDYPAAKKWLGVDFSAKEFVRTILKMRLDVQPKEGKYHVRYPTFRTDIRHEVDIFEDVAIGYGFDNIQPSLVPTLTIAEERPEEQLSTWVRDAMIGLGFTEIMSLALSSIERHFGKFLMDPGEDHVIVSNPKTIEQKVLRSHLMTGIMETFHKNRRKTVPQNIFELANVTHIDESKETRVTEYRHLAFGIMGPEAGYADVRTILDAVLRELKKAGEYKPIAHPAFCEGRVAGVRGKDDLWALVGEIHPQILNNFGLPYPVAYCELRLMCVI